MKNLTLKNVVINDADETFWGIDGLECNPHMVQFCVVDFKQGALAAKDFVCYLIHSILVVVVLDIS